MSSFQELPFSVQDFAGTVRLFPLPNLVLFPHVMQPLHIFEPRYRRLLEDAMSSDRLIAMALLEPGWEGEYEGRPRVCTTACLGRITTCHRLPDGTYNLLLLGMRRVKLLRELEPEKLYREAEVELCEDCYPAGGEKRCRALQRKLRAAFACVLHLMPESQEQIDQVLASDIPLGVLTDVVSFMLEIGMRQKVALLSEPDVYNRAELLLQHLDSAVQDSAIQGSGRWPAGEFPPRFSLN